MNLKSFMIPLGRFQHILVQSNFINFYQNYRIKNLHSSKILIEENFEENKFMENPAAMNLYKMLKSKNCATAKYRQEYQNSLSQ